MNYGLSIVAIFAFWTIDRRLKGSARTIFRWTLGSIYAAICLVFAYFGISAQIEERRKPGYGRPAYLQQP